MKYSFYFLIPLIIIAGLISCDKTKDIIPDYTLSIFPLDSGKYRISYVRDTTFDTRGAISEIYFKKELITDQISDLSGRNIYRTEIFRSENSPDEAYQFEVDRVWGQFANPSNSEESYAERIIENQRILVLKFPVFPGIEWNGNLFNNLGPEIYRYDRIDSSVVVNGIRYDSCVVVIQKSDTNSFITNSFAYEIYAPRVGLIKKFEKTLVNDGPNGEFNPDKSKIYIEEIVEHNY